MIDHLCCIPEFPHCRVDRLVIRAKFYRETSAGRAAAESLGGGTGERVSRGGRGRRPREGGANGGAPEFNDHYPTIAKPLTRHVGPEFCPSHEIQKLESELWNHAMVGAGHAAYTDRFHELARGNVGEPSKDRSGRDNHKRTRTGNAFATTVNPIRRENIASGQLVEIDKVIKGCKLEIEGHIFDIDLIPFGHGSFDVIIGMDWLSNFKAKIICHEKVVRIPLPDGKVLRVVGERPDEKARLLMSAKASDKKQEEIVVVRDFPEVFLDDLFGLLSIREIEFRIKLTPVAKSPYRLAPFELEELSGQLKELQDKGFIRLSSSPWRAPVFFVKKKDSSLRMFICNTPKMGRSGIWVGECYFIDQ
ncbi:putative reverse transcriptase domain-containing protein [Tanacetum coccineum]